MATRLGEAALDVAIETPFRGRGHSRGQPRGRSGRVAPVRDYKWAISPKPTIEPIHKRVPHDYVVTSLLQDTLLRVLSVLETLRKAGSLIDTFGTSQTQVRVQPQYQQQDPKAQVQVEQPLVASIIEILLVIIFTNVEHRRYKRFRKMDTPQFQGGKIEDTHEFLTTCSEILDVMGLGKTRGFGYVTFQFRGPTRN